MVDQENVLWTCQSSPPKFGCDARNANICRRENIDFWVVFFCHGRRPVGPSTSKQRPRDRSQILDWSYSSPSRNKMFVLLPDFILFHSQFPFVAVIDRTALFVARSANPPQFEDKIRDGQRSDPKFSFLNPVDPYHAYYRHRLDRIAQGDLGEETVQKETKPDGQAPLSEPVDLGVEPPQPQFILNLPNISAIDLYVLS